MNEPYTYKDRAYMDYHQIQPSEVKGKNNRAVEENKRYLYTKLYSVFQFDLPQSLEPDWFRFWLFRTGSISAIYTSDFGWVFLPYGVTKISMYYHPAEIEAVNHAIDRTLTGVIGVNAEIIYLMDDMLGLDDIVTKYAVKLAQVDKSIAINLMNANVALMYGAKNKKQADTIKEAYGKATEGSPLIAVNKDDLDAEGLKPLINNVKNTYIVTELQDARRTIVNEFLTEIGIKNANIDKRERLISEEVSANNDETKAVVSVIYDNLKRCFAKCRRLGCNIDVRLRYNYEMEGGAGNEIDSLGNE